MIVQNYIGSLLSQWEERSKKSYSNDYRIALGECIHELQETLGKIVEEENANLEEVIASLPPKEVEDYLTGLEADEYLASMDSHSCA